MEFGNISGLCVGFLSPNLALEKRGSEGWIHRILFHHQLEGLLPNWFQRPRRVAMWVMTKLNILTCCKT
jgi:hypothetical protein